MWAHDLHKPKQRFVCGTKHVIGTGLVEGDKLSQKQCNMSYVHGCCDKLFAYGLWERSKSCPRYPLYSQRVTEVCRAFIN